MPNAIIARMHNLITMRYTLAIMLRHVPHGSSLSLSSISKSRKEKNYVSAFHCIFESLHETNILHSPIFDHKVKM